MITIEAASSSEMPVDFYIVTSHNTAVCRTLVAVMRSVIFQLALFLKYHGIKFLRIFTTVNFVIWKYVACNMTLSVSLRSAKKLSYTQEEITPT
jgi:hypothetical protein